MLNILRSLDDWLNDWLIRIILSLLIFFGLVRFIRWQTNSLTLQIQPFDIIKKENVQRGQGQWVARRLSAKIRRIQLDLTESLPEPGDSSKVLAIAIPHAVLASSIQTPLVPTKVQESLPNPEFFRPFNFDIIGFFNFSASLLQRGPVLQGSVSINDDNNFEIVAQVSQNHWRTTGSLEDAIENLAYEVVFNQLQQYKKEPVALFDTAKDFQSFMSAHREFEIYLQQRGLERQRAIDDHLQKAIKYLKPLKDKKSRSSLPFSYLASIYTCLNDPENAEKFLAEAQMIDPNNQWLKDTRTKVKERLAAQRSTEQPGTLSELINQKSLELIRVQDAIQEAERIGRGQPVKVAVIADGFSSSLPELTRRISASKSFVPNEQSTQDAFGHGTSISALIAAIAPKAEIIPIKVLNSKGSGVDSSILTGIEYAIQQKVQILVLPIGNRSSDTSQIYNAMIQRAKSQNILPIASAGLEGSERQQFPANIVGMFTVAATDNQDRLASFSNYGSWVSLVAPGVDIETIGRDDKLQKVSGGSYSSAIIAGVAALVLSVRPELSATELEAILKDSAVDITAQSPELKGKLGAGRVDALAAVLRAKKFNK